MKTFKTYIYGCLIMIAACCSCKKEEHVCNNATQVVILGDQSKDWKSDGWNLYGWIAFGISISAGALSLLTFIAQTRTERHTQNAPIETQVGILTDLSRHFYRNLACTFAILLRKKEEETNSKYPSEGNMLKLRTMPDDTILNVDTDKDTYKEMHEYKLLLRNYCNEVEVASEHFAKNKGINEDIDNLTFKPLFLVAKSLKLGRRIQTQGKRYKEKKLPPVGTTSIYIMLNEHLDKLTTASNFNILRKRECAERLKDMLTNGFSSLDPKMGFERAYKFLLGNIYGNFHKNLLQNADSYDIADRFITYSIKGSEITKITIDKCKYIDMLRTAKYGKNKDTGKKTMQEKIMEIHDLDTFRDFYESSNLGKKITVENPISIDELYEKYGLQEYLDRMLDSSWNFEALLRLILSIDIAIETDRIGMVNY